MDFPRNPKVYLQVSSIGGNRRFISSFIFILSSLFRGNRADIARVLLYLFIYNICKLTIFFPRNDFNQVLQKFQSGNVVEGEGNK